METTATPGSSRWSPAGALRGLIEADLTRPTHFAALAAAFLIARAPLLGYGAGTDPDAWRVVVTGQYLWETGKYFPSRLPGNPLHELVIAPFVPLGWVATNLVTALAALVGVYVFARIVSHLRLPHAGLLTIGFAFTPLLFINSIATIDYMWVLTAILGAYYATLRRWPLWAGVLLGVAAGFRLQSLVVGLPLAYLMWRRGDFARVFPLGLAAAGTVTLAFAPVLAVYGLDFFSYYDSPVAYQDVIRLLGKESLGVIGSLSVLIGLAVSLPRLKRLPSDAISDPQVGAWLLLIGVYFLSFFRLPHEIAYLAPVFPFGLMLMARYLSRAVLTGVVASIILAGLVDITDIGDSYNMDALRSARIGGGLLVSNVQTMKNQRAFVEDVLRAPVPNHSVVLSGFVYPQLALRERDRLQLRILQRDYGAISMLSDRGEAVDEGRDVRYVWLLTYDAFSALRSQGYSFFIVPDAVGGTAALYDFRPTLFGATFLHLERASPSAGKGTAATDR